ncbi:efflux RND transporter periplasmic adaptor subunit [Metabacillus litoralis]|uniref:efflux RND transporter periplasmic adaptor subunit n=1 Tax=Metabacillus litoralis TaxID=152268 RepID=UPI000EF5E78F|nr:efflux RND transporter periplasmic adaptor subunit [Metabacillus litoralis]
MKKKIWIGIGVSCLIIILVGVNVFRTVSKENLTVDTIKVEEREMTGNVMVPGTLSLRNESFVYLSPESGKVAEILVKEGDKVEEGTPLLRYENEQLLLEKEQNALSLESSYLRINQVERQINDLDEKEEELTKQVGKDEAKKQVDAERDQLKTDLKLANIEARQVLLQKETIEKKLGELEVVSEISGTVLSISKDASKGVTQGAILHIAKPDELIVKGSISEYDSLKIKEKQPVTLRSDVVPGKEWVGVVSKVSLLPEQSENVMGNEESAVQYPIEVTIDDKGIKAKPGFKLIMDIQTEKRKALAVPLEAVKQDAEEYYVFVVEEGKAIRKIVKAGAASDEYMEIKTGLETGERVIVSPSNELQNNMEVNEK